MAFYADEEEVWKCPKHPSKRRRSGICPICLRDRLITLCPDCANVRPCACCTTANTPFSSSSSSSSFSLFFSGGGVDSTRSFGSVGRVPNRIDSEYAFRRSRSVAVPFRRSRFVGESDSGGHDPPAPGNRIITSFWSVFKTHKKNKKGEEEEGREDEEAKGNEVGSRDDYSQRVMMRSRSVSVPVASDSGSGDARSSSAKSRVWYFPSSIKFLRNSKTSEVVQERSPLHRG